MKVLVTGADGFVGRHLVRRLVEIGRRGFGGMPAGRRAGGLDGGGTG